MNTKIKTQKGFIQIPLLIIVIASIIVTSAGAGVVLHKQEKLASLPANISGVFKGVKETPTLEEEIKPEKPQLEQEQEQKLTEENVSQPEINEESFKK